MFTEAEDSPTECSTSYQSTIKLVSKPTSSAASNFPPIPATRRSPLHLHSPFKISTRSVHPSTSSAASSHVTDTPMKRSANVSVSTLINKPVSSTPQENISQKNHQTLKDIQQTCVDEGIDPSSNTGKDCKC